MKLRTACAGVILTASLGVPWGAAGESAGSADLSGRWRFNATLSSANAAAAPSATSAPPAKKKDEPEGAADKKDAEAKATPELTIRQSETTVVVDEKPGGTREYYPNGKTYKADGGESDIKSQWREGRLVFEKKTRQGWHLTETWEVTADRSRLTVETHVSGGGRPKASVTRVYERIVEEKP